MPQTAKYLVYKLPAESALIGVECTFGFFTTAEDRSHFTAGAICLEEFVKGTSTHPRIFALALTLQQDLLSLG